MKAESARKEQELRKKAEKTKQDKRGKRREIHRGGIYRIPPSDEKSENWARKLDSGRDGERSNCWGRWPRKESRTKDEKGGKFTGAGSIESRPRMKKVRTGRKKRELVGARKEQELGKMA